MPYTHHSHYHLIRLKEMGRIYWCHSVGILGVSLVLIFVPIYILKSGYSFQTVLLFLLAQQLLAALLQYPASRLLSYLHPHHQLVIGSLTYALFFGLLPLVPSTPWILGILALLWALHRTLYWTTFHYVFSSARAHEHGGRQIAGLAALAILAQTAAPAIGGVVATIFGINYIYAAAVVILLISVIPILRTAGEPPRVQLQLPWAKIRQIRRDVLANTCNGTIVMVEQNIWPLLVFLLVSSYAGVGLLSSAIALTSMLVTLYVGRREETRGERHYIKRGLAAYSLASLGRAAVQNTVQVFGLNLLGGIGRSLYVTPFMNRYYTHSDADNGAFRLGYITIMETAFSLGSSLYILILLLLSLWFSTQTVLAVAIALVAVTTLGIRSMR